MNEKCNNYKQELNAGADVCALCNEETAKIESNVNGKLAAAAIVAGLLSIVFFLQAWGIMWYVSWAIAPASIALGIVSKSRAAVIATVLSLIVIAALFVHFIIM